MSDKLPGQKRRESAQREDALSPMVLYSESAEKNVLGCILMESREVMDQVLIALRSEDFFVPAHVEIFDALKGMWTNKKPIELSSVHQWLVDWQIAEEVGSPGILGDLMTSYGSHLTISHYIETVKHKSQLRTLQKACHAIVARIAEEPDNVPAVLGYAEKLVMEVNEPSKIPTIRNAVDLVSAFEGYLGQIDRGERLACVKTHYSSFDRVNGGLVPGGYHVFGARSGDGKTTVMLNLGENLCSNGTGVGMITLEMDHLQYMTAIYAYMADINSRAFKAKLTDEQWEAVRWATNKVKDWNLQVDDCSLVDIHRMRHTCRRMVKQGAGVIMIDYLQLLETASDQAKSTRADQVSAMSRAIKLLAKELGVPIIVGAQLNRNAAESEPALHHLRESGSIEQDADVIILLRRKDTKDKSPRPLVCWNFAKWRGGRAGGFDLDFVFDMTRNRFLETTPRSEEQ